MIQKIYTLANVPAIGEIGTATIVEEFPECPVCKRSKRPVFKFIEYRFDRWAGEDFVTAMGYYAVSERLKRKLQQDEIIGIDFKELKVSRGDDFEIMNDAYSKILPNFYQLLVTGGASGPELWWTSQTCQNCGVKHWDITKLGLKAQGAVLTGEIGPPREVFKDSWQGDDVFHLEDPGFPVVTQKFVDLIQQQGVIGVVFHPAKWVERVKEK